MQTNHFAETPITIDEIFKKVPELKKAFNLAQMISPRPGVPFYANSIFYGFFRPIINFTSGGPEPIFGDTLRKAHRNLS